MKNKAVKIFSLILLIAVCATCLTACLPSIVITYEEGLFEFKGDVDDSINENTGRPWESAEFVNGLTIEYASLDFDRIGIAKFNKQNGRNVVKNNRNKAKYMLKLFIKFVGESEGKYYDFDFVQWCDVGAVQRVNVHFIDAGADAQTFDMLMDIIVAKAEWFMIKNREGRFVKLLWKVDDDVYNRISLYKQR